jgi:cytoplasmic iron level regulating protein YaaA (DUF328/UPF0246 family)
MVTILLHSSKTMRQRTARQNVALQEPRLSLEANKLATYLKTLPPSQIQSTMALSTAKAEETRALIESYSPNHPSQPALDIFLGDIYSGLQSQSLSKHDRAYANNHLFILSGLYGVLRALDEIQPYRLEMGYKLPGNAHDAAQPNITSLYSFWGDKIARQLPNNQPIIDLSAKEYTKAVFPHFKQIDGLKDVKIISPKFLTVSQKTGEPTFVTVHAKIARGAYARWLIQHRIKDLMQLKDFHEIGYEYNKKLSTEDEPVFVAKEFKGIGLSIRLTN